MNILFIAPFFFGYEKAIKKSLNARYEKVIFRCEVPFNSGVWFYALRRLSPALAEKALDRYATQLLNLIYRSKINKIFIIRGYGIRSELLAKIRDRFPEVEIINYQWDSIQNNPNGLLLGKYAHKNFTFDLADADRYPSFKHLPLFYIRGQANRTKLDMACKIQDIDLVFVGGYHSKRNEIVKIVREVCDQKGLRFISHLYLPLASYLRDKLSTREIDRRGISFRKISYNRYYKLLCRTHVVLDIQSATQSGATIRTIETLALGRKLISTNQMLRQECFFSPDNIMIWKPGEPLEIDRLLDLPFDRSKDEFVLNVEQWLKTIGV